MWDALVKAYATLALVPVLPFLLVFAIAHWLTRDRKRAVQLAMDITNFFLIGCVASLINERFGTRFGLFFLLLVMLIGGGLIGNAQNRLRGAIDAGRLVRAVWRITFLALIVPYVLLMLLRIFWPVAAVPV